MAQEPPRRILTEEHLRAIVRDEIGNLIENDVLGAAIRFVVTTVLEEAGFNEILAAKHDGTKVN